MVDVVDGTPSAVTLLRYLSYDNPHILGNALTRLEGMCDPIAKDRAVALLKHPDPYVWLPAASYLGAIRSQEAIPWLIKGLLHPAWRDRERVAKYLEDMTGKNFGQTQASWVQWWREANPDTEFGFTMTLKCGNCGTENVVATCLKCGKAFVITEAHLKGQPRSFDSPAVGELPAGFAMPTECDFCAAQSRDNIAGAVESGLRQRTCPKCHKEFLSDYKL